MSNKYTEVEQLVEVDLSDLSKPEPIIPITKDDAAISSDIINIVGGDEKKNNYIKQLKQVIDRLVKCASDLFTFEKFQELVRALVYKAEYFREIAGMARAALVRSVLSTYLYFLDSEVREKIIKNINMLISTLINKLVEEMNELLIIVSCGWINFKKQKDPSVLPHIKTLDGCSIK